MISIIIPCFNEEEQLSNCLSALQSFRDCEIIVIDGGSADKSTSIAESFSFVRVFSSPHKGRAAQMHFGSQQAHGDVYWFIHADTIVTTNHLSLLKCSISQGYLAGAFPLSFRESGILLHCNEIASSLRARFFRIFYGDQAMYCSRSAYIASKGFYGLGFMEDGFLSRKLSKLGKTQFHHYPISTSARNIVSRGTVKTLFLYWVITSLFLLGASAPRLQKIFQRLR